MVNSGVLCDSRKKNFAFNSGYKDFDPIYCCLKHFPDQKPGLAKCWLMLHHRNLPDPELLKLVTDPLRNVPTSSIVKRCGQHIAFLQNLATKTRHTLSYRWQAALVVQTVVDGRLKDQIFNRRNSHVSCQSVLQSHINRYISETAWTAVSGLSETEAVGVSLDV